MKSVEFYQIKAGLRRRYLLALSLIALLVICSQGLIQYALIDQEDDSRVVNIAGRQRMLSQRISKCALIVERTGDIEYKEELRAAVALWAMSHDGLQNGNQTLGLSGRNSQVVRSMFAEIEEPFQNMLQASANLSAGTGNDSGANEAALKQILVSQKVFLRGMDAIVFQYDAEAKAKINGIKRLEGAILIFTLLLLVLEALFIFRPAERQISQAVEELVRSESGLQKLFDMMPTPMLLVDSENWQLLRLNAAALKLLTTDAAGKSLTEFLRTNPEDHELWRQVVKRDSTAGVELPLLIQGQAALLLVFTTRTHWQGKDQLIMALVDITARHIHSQKMERLAATDPLTGLLNRRAFFENLSIAARESRADGQPLSLAYIDLNNLKKVNDAWGHQEGDWYINAAASFMRNLIRGKDFAGRIGGDEFAILFPGCSAEVAARIVSRIKRQVEEMAFSLEKPYEVGFCIGIAELSAEDDEDAKSLLQRADQAMYCEKRQGKEDREFAD